MRTIRFARHHHPKDETESAELFPVLDCRLPGKADDIALAFGPPQLRVPANVTGFVMALKARSPVTNKRRASITSIPQPPRRLSAPARHRNRSSRR